MKDIIDAITPIENNGWTILDLSSLENGNKKAILALGIPSEKTFITEPHPNFSIQLKSITEISKNYNETISFLADYILMHEVFQSIRKDPAIDSFCKSVRGREQGKKDLGNKIREILDELKKEGVALNNEQVKKINQEFAILHLSGFNKLLSEINHKFEKNKVSVEQQQQIIEKEQNEILSQWGVTVEALLGSQKIQQKSYLYLAYKFQQGVQTSKITNITTKKIKTF